MRKLALALLLLAVGCGTTPGAANTPGNGNGNNVGGGGSSHDGGGGNADLGGTTGQDGSTGTMTDGGTSTGTSGLGAIKTIFTVVLENTDYDKIVGNTNDAPYLNSLIQQYGLATKYQDSGTHPSLPNYLYMTSGNTQYFGVVDVGPTSLGFPKDVDNLGHQLTQAGVPWRAYLENMGKACNTADNSPYAAKHNPFVYYTDIVSQPVCQDVDVDYSNFAADLAAGTYRYMWITPNLNDDGHDTDLATADKWCSQEIPKILASKVWKDGGVLLITWDEGDTTEPDHIPMIVVSPLVKAGFQSATAYSHASYLATVEDVFHLPRLGAAQSAKALTDFFP